MRFTGSTASEAFKFNQKDNVLAVIGNVGTPTAMVAVPLATEGKTLLFAPFAGGPILRNDPPDRYVINFRAGYDEETVTMIDALIDVGGLKPESPSAFSDSPLRFANSRILFRSVPTA